MRDLATCKETFEPITGQRMIIRDVPSPVRVPHTCARCKAELAVRYVTTQLRFDEYDRLWSVSVLYVICENPDCMQARCYRWHERQTNPFVPDVQEALDELFDEWNRRHDQP